MDESAEMSACLELLRLGVMALHGETLGQRATIHGAVREAVGRSALISATLTPLCSPQVLACLLSCMCANVWRVSGVLMRWIWLVASTDAIYALGACRFRMGEKELSLPLDCAACPHWKTLNARQLPRQAVPVNACVPLLLQQCLQGCELVGVPRLRHRHLPRQPPRKRHRKRPTEHSPGTRRATQ